MKSTSKVVTNKWIPQERMEIIKTIDTIQVIQMDV